jgi:hypothetical protein
MGGAAARAPVAMTALAKRNVCPPTSMVSGPVNFPAPRKMSTPRSVKRLAESCGLMSARSRRIRSMSLPKSAVAPGGTFTPNSPASRTAATARAARMMALDGTQPTLRQSPPMKCFSMSATFAPSPAAPMAVTNPAVPAPMTTRL